MIINHDKRSAEYLKRFYHLDWADPLHYDLVIVNTGRLDAETAVQLIVEAVRSLPPAA